MCSSLDPDINYFSLLEPFASKILQEELTGGLSDWLAKATDMLSLLVRLFAPRPSGLGPPAVAPAPGRRRHVGYDPPTSLGFVPSEVPGRPAACDHPAERSWTTGCGARTGPTTTCRV